LTVKKYWSSIPGSLRKLRPTVLKWKQSWEHRWSRLIKILIGKDGKLKRSSLK